MGSSCCGNKCVTEKEKTCGDCSTVDACVPLKNALDIIFKLEKVDQNLFDREFVSQVASLKKEILDTGFSYPNGNMDCSLVNDHAAATDLFHRASVLLAKGADYRVKILD